MTSILGALTSVTQLFTFLQDTVNQLLKASGHTEKVYDVNREIFNLHQWYTSNKSCPNDDAFQHVQTAQGDLQSNQGVRSDFFTNVDMLSPNLQKKDIIEGKDINLATLLNPLYDCPTKYLVVANGIEVSVTGKHDKNLYHSWKITRSFPRTHVRTYYSFLIDFLIRPKYFLRSAFDNKMLMIM